jgi:hypothetical protein
VSSPALSVVTILLFQKAEIKNYSTFWNWSAGNSSTRSQNIFATVRKPDFLYMTALFAAKQIAGTLKSPCAATDFRFQNWCNFFGVKFFAFEHG